MEEIKKKGLNRFNSSPQNETLHALNVYQNVIDSVVIKKDGQCSEKKRHTSCSSSELSCFRTH